MSAPIFAALSGALVHLLLWIRGEWDAYSGHIVLYALLLHTSLAVAIQHIWSIEPAAAHVTVLNFELCHLLGTAASILVYRVFFHRLRHFPGPITAKIWIWDIFIRTWISGHRQSIVIDELHRKYGPVVRYAPDRLSINYAAAVPIIHGTGSTSRCTKSVVYLNPVNGGSINADRNVASHHDRRRTWERALSTRMLPSYISPLSQLTSTLISKLQTFDGEPMSLNKHIQLFTFDAMGLIGFGRDGGFDGLTSGILNPAMTTIIDMMNIGVYMMLVPWLHVFLDYIPTMGIIYKPDELFRDFAKKTLSQYCDQKAHKHIKDEENVPISTDTLENSKTSRSFKDILNQIHPNPSLEDRRTLSDCVLLSIAGADTTTSSLVHTIYRLARHTDLQRNIFHEVLEAGCPVRSISWQTNSRWETDFAYWVRSAQLPLLEAFIKEVLRLHPPAPTGLPRLAPAEGFTFMGHDGEHIFVPGDTNVSSPVYTLLRDPRNFERPLEFLPQRFLPSSHRDADPALVLDSRAYIPFLQGPYGCAGKQFAYLEMKIVIAGLLSVFEIAFAESASLGLLFTKMEKEWRDFSTVKAAQIEVRFMTRQHDPRTLPRS